MAWVYVGFLGLIYGALIYVYVVILAALNVVSMRNECFRVVHSFLPSAFIILAVGLGALLNFVCRRWQRDNKHYWRAGLVALLTLPLAVLSVDQPPLKNDYTRADSAPSSRPTDESCRALLTYPLSIVKFKCERPFNPAMPVSNALPYAAEIEQAWRDLADGRRYIEKLDSFDHISDVLHDGQPDWEIRVRPNLDDISYISFVYTAYVLLKVQQGEAKEGVRHLVQLHSVSRKAMPHCVTRRTWTACAERNIQTAYHVIAEPQCTREALEVLKDNFSPLTEEELSPRGWLIFAYLQEKHRFEQYPNGVAVLEEIEDDLSHGYGIRTRGPWLAAVLRTTTPLWFHRNRTIREVRRQYDMLINASARLPYWIVSCPSRTKSSLRNVAGQYIAESVAYGDELKMSSDAELKVTSDLLAILIHRRLGQEIALRDCYTGGEYLIDAKTDVPSSVGRDGKAGTIDDIRFWRPCDVWWY